jgi:hypothetical protein
VNASRSWRGSVTAYRLLILVAAGLSLTRPGDAAGQLVLNHAALDPARPNVLQIVTGADYGFVAGVGYGRSISVGTRTLLVSAGAVAPWARMDARDFDVHVGATVGLAGQRRWRLIGGLGGSLRATQNAHARMRDLAADGVLMGGYWTPGWFVTAEVGYDNAIATHIEHSDYYRARIHPDARDGWYVDTGANIRVGLAGGLSFGHHDLVLRAGQARDREGHAQLLPAYVTLGLNLRF